MDWKKNNFCLQAIRQKESKLGDEELNFVDICDDARDKNRFKSFFTFEHFFSTLLNLTKAKLV